MIAIEARDGQSDSDIVSDALPGVSLASFWLRVGILAGLAALVLGRALLA